MLFCQRDYNEELGTGTGATIAEFGCAEVSISSLLVNCFGKPIDPLILNHDLISINGYASNGAGAYDIIDWAAISKVFSDITLAWNYQYYNPPLGAGKAADMSIIDAQLAEGKSVIVGVSFNHDPKESAPTHYVELYKKNTDGTYQCRDPWYTGNECDTVFDERYAVNGMSVANCILQAISYNGQVDKTKEAPINTFYKVGNEIKISKNIATGASTSTISFDYGHIGADAPALVTGITLVDGVVYYEISQAFIGGGTGFALASDIDANVVTESTPATPTTPPVEPVAEVAPQNTVKMDNIAPVDPVIPPDPLQAQIPPVTPAQKIDTLSSEKETLVQKLQELGARYKEDLDKYQGLVAGGYERIEDVLKAIEEVAKENVGVKKQLVQVLRRNKAYHLDIASKDEEDATAIEVGMKYESLYKDVKSQLTAIAKACNTKPSMLSILSVIDRLKSTYDGVVRQLRRQNVAQAVSQVETTIGNITPSQEAKGVSYIERLLSFKF